MIKLIDRCKSNSKIQNGSKIIEYILLFLYTFSLPSFSAKFPYNIISYILMGALLINTMFFMIVYDNKWFKMHLFVIPLFVTWIAIGTIIYSHYFRGLLTLFMLSVTMLIFYYSFKIINNFKHSIIVLILAIGAFSVFFIAIYWKSILNFASFVNGDFRLGSYFDNVNHIGTYFYLGFALSFYFLLFGSFKEKWFFIIGVVFLLLGMTTGSREFVVNIVLIVAILLFFKFKKRKWIYLLVLFSVVSLIVLLMYLPFMATMRIRFEKMFAVLIGGGGEGSTTTRLIWQLYGTVLGSQNIVPGYGFYGFGVVSGVGTYTHANHSEIICNGGIVGFCLFYGYFVYIICKTARSNNSYKKLAASLSLALIISSPVSIFYASKETYLFLGLILAIMDTKFNGEIQTYSMLNKYANRISFYGINI